MDSDNLILSENELNSDNPEQKGIIFNESKDNSDDEIDENSDNNSEDLNDESDEFDDINDSDEDESENLNELDNSDDSDDLEEFDDPKSDLIEYENQDIYDTEDSIQPKKIPDDKRITKPILTKYEFNRIYGLRLKHITSGSKLLISLSENLSIEKQVQQEIYQKKTPFIVRRNLPNNYYEDWKLKELFIPNVLFM